MFDDILGKDPVEEVCEGRKIKVNETDDQIRIVIDDLDEDATEEDIADFWGFVAPHIFGFIII